MADDRVQPICRTNCRVVGNVVFISAIHKHNELDLIELMNEAFVYAWQFFRNNFKYIVQLSAPFTLLAFLSNAFFAPEDKKNMLYAVLGLFVCVSMFISSLIFFMSQTYQDKLQPVKKNIINGLVYTPLLLLTFLIADSPIIAAGIIILSPVSQKFVAFPLVLAGIYISIKATFAPFHLILEGHSPLTAIKNSFQSTNGMIGKIIVILLVFHFSSSLVESLTSFGTKIVVVNFSMLFIGVAVTMLLVAFQQIAIFKLYVDSFKS